MNHEHPEQTALAGIEAMINYFRTIGMPTTFAELGIKADSYEKIADWTTDFGKKTLSSYVPLGKKEIMEIYKLAE
jgi:alcohol dehydrogenase YqhD (iron-dependent ADH family)